MHKQNWIIATAGAPPILLAAMMATMPVGANPKVYKPFMRHILITQE
jgi:type IV secretory pathway TrbD component